MRVLVIAEAGVNHNGDPALARDLVDAASEAGADVIKFQTFTAKNLVTRSAPKAEYQLRNFGGGEDQLQMLEQLEIDDETHRDLVRRCSLRGIQFLSTGFDIESIDYLSRLDLPFFKVPSGEITNLPYLRHIARFDKDVLISTGMATLGEVEAALVVFDENGLARERITVLHCTTEYPAPIDEVNLAAMENMRKVFGVKVGYSDHTKGIEVPIAAVAMGATVIEKHFTLSKSLPGPDHVASLEPDELRAMVEGIRNIEKAVGDGVKRPTASELKNKHVARKSIVARRYIQKGQLFSEDNLAVKRPGTGISPMRWDDVIGRVAIRDFDEDELIVL